VSGSSATSGKLLLTTKSGSWVVDIGSLKTTIEFERHFNVSAQVLQLAPRVEYIAFMAWSAGRDAGYPLPDDFDTFLGELVKWDDVDEDGSANDVNPTDGGQ